jgi:hypothetical protein
MPHYRPWLRIMWFATLKVVGLKPSNEATAEIWFGGMPKVVGSAPSRMMPESRCCGIEKVAASGLSSKVAGATGSSATVRVAVAYTKRVSVKADAGRVPRTGGW